MTSQPDAPAEPCACQSCSATDLPVNPFLALRVAYGMLLGEDDFRTLMGNPRGKHMLHAAWLHGCGVVWGYRVSVEGERTLTLKVSPGLAVDGLGRELLADTSWCLDVRQWLTTQHDAIDQTCRTQTLHAHLVVRHDCCPTTPVPTLADPCDITRKHDDYSRVAEGVRLELRLGRCPVRSRPYHRVRVLLGLDDVGDDDPAGENAAAALDTVLGRHPDERPRAMLREFRRMASADAADLAPASEPGENWPTLFPVLDSGSDMVLAGVEIDLRDRDGRNEIDVHVDCGVRTTLLPTSALQELTCAVTPAVLSRDAVAEAGGPRVIPEVEWNEDATMLSFRVTAPLVHGSLSRRAVQLTSLAERGWVEEDIDSVRYDDAGQRVTVTLNAPPGNEVVRLIARGTGGAPIFGRNPAVPLAGLVGGPPGDANDGHDAVLTLQNPLTEGAQR
jgi:hypothetical protein